MMYQFMDWRIGLHRRFCVVRDVENLFRRLRESNGGQLPYCLSHWDHILIFAGEAGILLPENQRVAETTIATDAYPDLEWVRKQYEEFIQWIAGQKQYAKMLDDPPYDPPHNRLDEDREKHPPVTSVTLPPSPAAPPTPAADSTPPAADQTPPKPDQFDTIVEGSVSNTDDKQCLAQPPATASPTSTLTGSPNSSSTGKNRRPQPQQR